ncbi:DUF2442 domain-containing protein [Actinoplanes sp. NPDC026619]|uniref:DUF2442 domain-containing protein n=1 Tax=Actinoplanes sp. NPDC026619 TaxID=3155798 RepID=UPI0034059ADD
MSYQRTRIRAVERLRDHWVEIEFEDGAIIRIDLLPYLHGRIFQPLIEDPGVFAAYFIDSITGTLEWPNGANIDTDVLRHGLTPSWAEGLSIDFQRVVIQDSVRRPAKGGNAKLRGPTSKRTLLPSFSTETRLPRRVPKQTGLPAIKVSGTAGIQKASPAKKAAAKAATAKSATGAKSAARAASSQKIVAKKAAAKAATAKSATGAKSAARAASSQKMAAKKAAAKMTSGKVTTKSTASKRTAAQKMTPPLKSSAASKRTGN